MTTQTQTLAAFLLARVAEDEAAASNWSRFEVRNGIPGNYAIPERVRAECEAKRRIVDTANRMVLDADDRENHMSAQERFMAARIAHNLLASLAAIYADHPEYDKAWRP